MMKLFGTDGIRGLAGQFPLDENTVPMIGASLTRLLKDELGRAPSIVTGRDTRESGSSIESAFQAGAVSEGAKCVSTGVLTTPGIAYITSAFTHDAGVVISASHNPYEDNGIKIFGPTGKKMRASAERLVERDVEDGISSGITARGEMPHNSDEYCWAYLEHLRLKAKGVTGVGLKIVLDCANGAASGLAPQLFEGLGAEVIAINCGPDGQNINKDCGSLHLDKLQAAVLEHGANLGVAFDGDADRALFVDENGNIVDGDMTLWIMAQYLKRHDKLSNQTVVSTVMSNIGLELALRSIDLDLDRADVGDKYVLAKLLETGSEIGGEQSGHIIFPEISLVGDGMMTALLVVRAIRDRGETLSQSVEGFTAYPQILVNVKVANKLPFDEVPAITAAAKEIESEFNGDGRLLLRYSGTENLARVMIEGKEQSVIDEQAARLADVIRVNLA